jgi:putative ABC transport system permease protein
MTDAQWKAENERRKTEYLQLLEDIRAIPGVEHAALADKTAWTGYHQYGNGISVVSRQGYSAGQNRWVSAGDVSSGYFETMGIPIVRGRAFDRRDSATSTPVAVVCEQLARLMWPDKDPLGEYIARFDARSSGGEPPRWMQVIGVAREVKVAGMEDRNTPFLYTPIEQEPRIPSSSVVVRGTGAAGPNLIKTIWRVVLAAHPDADMTRARTMQEEIAQVLYPRRLGAAILTVAGLFGLLLSTVGLYGVVSYSAARRMREVGVRTALGADRRDILVLLLREALFALLVGVGCGVAMGYAAVRIVSSKVVAIPALDTLTLVGVSALLSVVILSACLVPARRAARMNPVEVLRTQ